ncbi:MAG: phage tail tape measure protein [Lachnospiraceae bacterium]|nr:phage tail tape measure protein [Lachnospiraceae bacterium]
MAGKTVESRVKVYFDADGSPFKRVVSEIEKTAEGTKKTVLEAVKTNKKVIDDGAESAKQAGGIFSKFGDDVAKGMAMGFGIGVVDMVANATQMVVNFAKESVAVGAEFEQAMANVKAITGSTGESFTQLTDFARELGKTTMMSAQESAEAMSFLGMAGWDTTQIMAGLPNILNLTIASGRDFATVADIVSDNLTAFGMSADESGRYTDALAYAMSNANVNMDTLGESLKYIAPVASSAGFSMEETVSAVMALGDAGIKGSQAGTTLRTVMLNLTGANEKATAKLKELGVEIFDSSGKTRSFNAIIKDLEGALEGMTDAQKTATLNTIVGKTAISGFSTLVNQGADKLNEYTKGIRNSSGATQEMADTMGDTLQGKIKLFQSAVQELQISISDKLAPALKLMVDMGTGIINQFNGAEEKLGAFGVSLGDVSTRTQETLQPFADMRTEMNTLMMTTKSMGVTTSSTFEEMSTIAENWRTRSIENLQAKQSEERELMMSFFSESLGLEGKALNERMAQYDAHYQLEQDTVNNAMDKIIEIKENAKNEKRDLTQEECDEIMQIMQNESQRMIELEASKAEEERALMEALASDKSAITKENYQDILNQAQKHKEEMINSARTSMEEQIRQAYRSKEMGLITEQEYSKIVKSAKENFGETKKEAESAFKKVKTDVTTAVTDAGLTVSEKTGEISDYWGDLNEQFNRGISGTVKVKDEASGILGGIKKLWNNLFGKSSTKTATVKTNTKGFKTRSMATPDTRISTLGTTHYPSTMSESYQSNNSVTYNGDLVFKSKGDIDYFLKQTARAIDRRY